MLIEVKTRDDAESKMKLGNSFEATCNVTPYNRNMLNFYCDKYKYRRTKVRRGIDLYEPIEVKEGAKS